MTWLKRFFKKENKSTKGIKNHEHTSSEESELSKFLATHPKLVKESASSDIFERALENIK